MSQQAPSLSLPNIAGTLQAPSFSQNLTTAISMAKESGRESGFFVWFDGERVRVNQPILGEETQMRDHGLGPTLDIGEEEEYFVWHSPGTGFCMDQGGLLLCFVQIHPGTRPYLHFPSVGDIFFLRRNMSENKKLAEWFYNLDFWPNPLALIATTAGKISLTQFPAQWADLDLSDETVATLEYTYPDLTGAWKKAFLTTFQQSFGHPPKTEVIDETYAAAVIVMTDWPNWLLSPVRLERFFKAINIPYFLTDLGGLSQADLSEFSLWVEY